MGIQQENLAAADRILEKLVFFCTQGQTIGYFLVGCRKSLISPKLSPTITHFLGRILIRNIP
jgi:hypothetical protein